jgi:glutamine---fructose-6-phosphate transaminase (isomerizing)
MCGIVGSIGCSNVKGFLLTGLQRLEYRGYDSAGICLLQNGEFNIVRAVGKIKELEKQTKDLPESAKTGIGHTRWATHGKVNEANAHPHVAGSVALVHNGIVENFFDLKKELQREGRQFNSDTDTEIIAHLIDKNLSAGMSPEHAIINTIKKMKGIFSLGILIKNRDDALYAVKCGTPLVVGKSKEASYIASDVYPMLDYADTYAYLDDYEVVRLTPKEIKVFNLEEKVISKSFHPINMTHDALSKSGYRYYMEKEIYEQPIIIINTIQSRISNNRDEVLFEDMPLDKERIKNISKIYIVACGTAWHAALVGKYYIEKNAGIPVEVDIASEFRYREPILNKDILTVLISQSGETADTLAACKEAKRRGSFTIAVCNRQHSSLHREADFTVFTQAGVEIGVAATKSFTAQVAVMLLVSLYFGTVRGVTSKKDLCKLLEEIVKLPLMMEKVLQQANAVFKAIETYYEHKTFLFIGRGIHYPLALEGALKLKEITYIHAEGYPAGELKHGPIALVDEQLVLVALAPMDHLYEKALSNIEEVKARGASVIGITTEGDTKISHVAEHTIFIPDVSWEIMPMLEAIPVQMLALYLAIKKGTDVDQPRNLAKSVTVE